MLNLDSVVFFLLVATMCYVVVSLSYIKAGQYGLGLAFAAYSVANMALLASGEGW